MEKKWVWLPRASLEYEQGVRQFVSDSTRNLGNPIEMFCPCINCRNVCHQMIETVYEHLVIKGMDPKYKRNSCWIKHGDIRNGNTGDVLNSESEAYELIRTAFAGEGSPQRVDHIGGQSEESESIEDSEFMKKLKDAESPLYSTCPNHTKVSAIMALYRIKVKSGMSENYFDQLLATVHDMLPEDNVLPKSTDEMKKFLKIFGFGYDLIHACKNDCVLYRKEYEKMESCPRCSASRWEIDKHTGEEKKGIPTKVLRYFPIKERFKRMFRSKKMAEDLRWHSKNACVDGTMRHPVDSLTWAQVNAKWPEFAAEPRNLRLGLSTDGMNPFSIQNTKYSTWPVLLVNYNMPPTICMKAENIMLTMLIPGPTAPSNNIDVYLAPLIDDLNDLWSEGIEVYDSFQKEKFTLKALLMWTISDYPALGTLSGCKVKGKQACNVCGKDTHCRWLKFSRKYVYMGNRKRLRPGHPYRHRKGWFDNTVEDGTANRIQTGREIFEVLKDFQNDFGKPLAKESKRKRSNLGEDAIAIEEEHEEQSDQWRWKKRSIFFDLPYWKDMPVRHNIDVMHVEKNVSEAILSTLMGSAKSKDGYKARKDLEDMGIRSNLHTEARGKTTYLPPAAYWMSKVEKKIFCQRLSKFRGPDGYCANIANCVSVNPPLIGSMKSHDHHVLMQNLLPVALRGLLPKGPRIAVTRLCNYFCYFVNSSQKSCDGVASQSVASDFGKPGVRCQLLDWSSSEDVVVGEGELCSTEQTYKIGRIPLGPNAVAVLVKNVVNPDAFLWRPTETHALLGEAVGLKIHWPMKTVILDEDNVSQSGNKADGPSGTPTTGSTERCKIYDWNVHDCVIAEGVILSYDPKEIVNNIPLGPNAVMLSVDKVLKHDAYLWRPSTEMSNIGDALNGAISWPLINIELVNKPGWEGKAAASATNSTGTTNGAKKKCIMLDCNDSGQAVAEGRVCSTDPAERVHFVPLGTNASKVWVEVSKIDDARVWKPNSEVQYIFDAVGTTIAWPNDKLKFV